MIAWAVSGGEAGVWIGLATAAIGLATALINHLTARRNRVPTPAPAAAGALAQSPRFALPGRDASFVNRTRELRDAIGKIRAGEVALAIEGGFGVGKSATATELAYCIKEDGGERRSSGERDCSYLMIDCKNRCPTLAEFCASLASLTGDQSLSKLVDSEKFDRVRAHLAEHRTVLVLDNLKLGDDEDSATMCRLIETVPHGSLVIASLNGPSELAGARVRLEDLEPQDARRLIRRELDRIGLERGGLGDDFADRVLSIWGGNPRMITLFLRRLDNSPESVDDLLAAAERGRGLEGLLEPIWDELTGDAQTALGICAHLRGQATASQLAIGSDLPEDRVALALERLLGAGLLRTLRIGGRPNVFLCGEGIRQFALGKTSSEAIAAFTGRLADHYTRYFSEHWEDAAGAISHVDAIPTVVEQLYGEGRDDEVYELFYAVLDIFFTLGRFDERLDIAALACRSAERSGDQARLARALACVTMTRMIRGELEEARAALADGWIAATGSKDRRQIARQMRVKGCVLYQSRRPHEALAAVEGADDLAREVGDIGLVVDILDVRAASHWYLGALDECKAAAEEHLRLCHEIPWERAKAYSLRMLAEVAIGGAEFERARDLLERARGVSTEYEDRRMLVRIGITEARLQLACAHPAALPAASAAEREARRLGLGVEAREARALRRAGRAARLVPPLRLYCAWRRPSRLTDAPVGGD